MQMALCSFLSLTGPSLWPQAVIKAVISSYSLKESARLWEGLREGWGGREGGRKRGRTAGCRRRDGTILFLKKCRVVEPAFWGKRGNVFIIVVFHPVCRMQRSKFITIASFMSPQMLFSLACQSGCL